MVSFQCESCGDVFTKKKLDAHRNRCWNSSFTCLDCHTQFLGQDYKSHTSCITEDQKYQGKYYKDKKQKPVIEQHQSPTTAMPRTPYQAYVKEVADEPTPPYAAIAQIHVPPRAPSPPSAAIPPVNVFDFLVSGSASPSSASSQSTYASDAEDSDVSMSPEMGRTPLSPRSPLAVDFYEPNLSVHPDSHYIYGSGPIETSNERFNSEYDLNMQLQQVEEPPAPPQLLPPISMAQTPAPATTTSPAYSSQPDSRSDKKRKRPQVEDLDLTTVNEFEGRGILHTGLTGGLMKMVNGSTDHSVEASPLSPKKRSKQTKDTNGSKALIRKDPDRSHRRKERRGKENRPHKTRHDHADDTPSANLQSKQERRSRRRQQRLLLEGRKDMKAIEYHPNGSVPDQNGIASEQTGDECNSAYFLRLVDKNHRSVKGQSVWGLLKMFHEGRRQNITLSEEEAEETRIKEERLLFKGLRAKISKNGDIVLFSRPEAETDE